MDHAINSLQDFMDVEIEEVFGEWESGKYKKLSDCPSYPAAKALVEARHTLELYYYGQRKTASVREQLKWRGAKLKC